MRGQSTLVAVFVSLALYALESVAEFPRPDDLHVVTPDVSIAPNIAAFSGEWHGVWGGVLKSALIVEEISSEAAKVTYTWADAPEWKLTKGFERWKATVTPAPKPEIRFSGSTSTFTITMNADEKSLTVTRSRFAPPARVDVAVFYRPARP